MGFPLILNKMAASRLRLRKLLYLLGFLDMLSVSIFYPILFKSVQSRGVSPSVAGLIGSLYGVLQIFSSTPLGRVSDKCGRKFGLLLAYSLPGLGYLVGGLTTSVAGMLVARMIPGVFKHGITIGKAFLADITSAVDRPGVLGMHTAFGNAGFIIGPLIGGYLADSDPTLSSPILASAVLFLAIAVLVLIFFPDSSASFSDSSFKETASCTISNSQSNSWTTTESSSPVDEVNMPSTSSNCSVSQNGGVATDTSNMASSGASHSPSWLYQMLQYCNFAKGIRWREHADLIAERFLFTLAMLLFRQSFPLLLQERFEVDYKTLGTILSFNGLVATPAAFSVQYLVKWYGAKGLDRLIYHALILLCMTLAMISMSHSLILSLLLLAPLSLSTSILRVVHTNTSISRARLKEKGAIVGLANAIASFSRTLSPTIGAVLHEHSLSTPGLSAAVLIMLGFGIASVFPPSAPLSRKQKIE